MIGEPTVSPPQSPASEAQLLTRPPCASSSVSALGKVANHPDQAAPYQRVNRSQVALEVIEGRELMEHAVDEAGNATHNDCQNCLEGAGISCPLKSGKEPTEILFDLQGLDMPRRRIIRIQSGEAPARPVPLDKEYRLDLEQAGYPQLLPTATGVPEEALLSPSVVPDPRPPEAIERETLENDREERPECAQQLSKFIKSWRSARSRWRERNHKKPREEWSTFRHPDSLKIYRNALEAAETVDPTFCGSCLDEDCPLKNQVDAEDFYEEAKIKITLDDGTKTKPLSRLENILDGLPWSKLIGGGQIISTLLEVLRNIARKDSAEEDVREPDF